MAATRSATSATRGPKPGPPPPVVVVSAAVAVAVAVSVAVASIVCSPAAGTSTFRTPPSSVVPTWLPPTETAAPVTGTPYSSTTTRSLAAVTLTAGSRWIDAFALGHVDQCLPVAPGRYVLAPAVPGHREIDVTGPLTSSVDDGDRERHVGRGGAAVPTTTRKTSTRVPSPDVRQVTACLDKLACQWTPAVRAPHESPTLAPF
jgi:hypothetical protein